MRNRRKLRLQPGLSSRELINGATPLARFACQAESRLDSFLAAADSRGHIFPNGWAMFETLPGFAAHQPDNFKIRMSIDQKITMRSVLVLADARLNHRRVF